MVDDEDEPEDSGRESNRSKAARMKVIETMVRAMVDMQPAVLATLPLPEDIHEAVVACQGFTRNARARQLRRIGALLRTVDNAPIAAAIREVQTGRGERSRREQSYEHWRTRLLQGGDAALTELVRTYPDADAQVLRNYVRVAAKEPESPRGKRASRELFRAIRALGEAAANAPTDEDAT
ncbi:MAG TPA: ribosome biogenesis factor YjgA [Nannocystaceae bacterium]|nr:ribosome biogenesis factor YjgA [Nannocystaceae bacterium]